MTIKELVERLQEFPADTVVELWDGDQEVYSDQVIVRYVPQLDVVQITAC